MAISTWGLCIGNHHIDRLSRSVVVAACLQCEPLLKPVCPDLRERLSKYHADQLLLMRALLHHRQQRQRLQLEWAPSIMSGGMQRGMPCPAATAPQLLGSMPAPGSSGTGRAGLTKRRMRAPARHRELCLQQAVMPCIADEWRDSASDALLAESASARDQLLCKNMNIAHLNLWACMSGGSSIVGALQEWCAH